MTDSERESKLAIRRERQRLRQGERRGVRQGNNGQGKCSIDIKLFCFYFL